MSNRSGAGNGNYSSLFSHYNLVGEDKSSFDTEIINFKTIAFAKQQVLYRSTT